MRQIRTSELKEGDSFSKTNKKDRIAYEVLKINKILPEIIVINKNTGKHEKMSIKGMPFVVLLNS